MIKCPKCKELIGPSAPAYKASRGFVDKDGNFVVNPKDNVQNAHKTKKKRCPNGQRRNKNTGECESK